MANLLIQKTSIRMFQLYLVTLKIKIFWTGKGINEIGYTKVNGKKEIVIKIDKKYFRPNEVNYLKGDAKKAFKVLKFKPKYTFEALVKDMIEEDLKLAKKEMHENKFF